MSSLENIVVLAGYSAAGKSSIARELQARGFGLVEHQAVVHEMAMNRGYDRARYWLTAVGMNVFVEESVTEMVRRINSLGTGGKSGVVLDVVYGNQMLETFREEFEGARVIVVAVLAERDLRLKRIKDRMGTRSDEEAEQELSFRDSFLQNVGLAEVMKRADMEITNEGEIPALVEGLVGGIMNI